MNGAGKSTKSVEPLGDQLATQLGLVLQHRVPLLVLHLVRLPQIVHLDVAEKDVQIAAAQGREVTDHVVPRVWLVTARFDRS